MKESKADAIDATPSQKIHHEVVPQGAKMSEASLELVGATREPYGPSGMSFRMHPVVLLY
jgi:hypothetical protein